VGCASFLRFCSFLVRRAACCCSCCFLARHAAASFCWSHLPALSPADYTFPAPAVPSLPCGLRRALVLRCLRSAVLGTGLHLRLVPAWVCYGCYGYVHYACHCTGGISTPRTTWNPASCRFANHALTAFCITADIAPCIFWVLLRAMTCFCLATTFRSLVVGSVGVVCSPTARRVLLWWRVLLPDTYLHAVLSIHFFVSRHACCGTPR
jgi:hypothetical protein